MSDGSGCLHEAMKNSFKIPTSMECAQCGKSELLILRHRIASAEQDKLGLIKVTHGLQDRIASLEAENQRLRDALEKGEASDGYHTHNELYEFRKLYNAALFNAWEGDGDYSVHKSLRHHDGSLCFGGGWFIVVAMLPTGQISNHYKIEDWNLFRITEADSAWFEYDGHTGADVINRLKALLGGGDENASR